MTEEWRDVPGHEGAYQVSDGGRVRSLPRRVRLVVHGQETTRSVPGRVLKPGRQNRFGHVTVSIGKGNSRTVHSLVLEAFVGPRPTGADVAHNNGIGSDNRLSNLRYASRGDNNRDKVLHGKTKLSVEQVQRVREVAGSLPHGGKKALAEALGVSPATVSDVLYGRAYSHV